MQMRLCTVKQGVVSSIYGDFWEESGVEIHILCAQFSRLRFIKGFLHRFWRMHGFINLKKITRTQNLAFVRTYIFRMKSTESFINETPEHF